MSKALEIMQNSLITVVMPAYNHQEYVGEAIESVLRQTYTNFELIIIDDGSTDNTADVINLFSDSRIHLEHQSNRGSAHAINRGIARAQGEFIAIINSDDRFHPERLARLVSHIQMHDLDFLATNFNLINSQGTIVEDPEHTWLKLVAPIRQRARLESPLVALLYGNFTISTSNFFFRRSLFEAVGRFRRYRFVQDWEYALRVAFYAPERIGFLDEALFDYRLHGRNTIQENSGVRCSSEIVRMYIRILSQQYPELAVAFARLHGFSLDIRRSLKKSVRNCKFELLNIQVTSQAQILALQSELNNSQINSQAQIAALEFHQSQINNLNQYIIKTSEQQAEANQHIDNLNLLLQDSTRQLADLNLEVKKRDQHIEILDQQLAAIMRSRSWRLTRPIRGLGRILRTIRPLIIAGLQPVWQRLPLTLHTRYRLKSALFKIAPLLFRGTAAYNAWLQQSHWEEQGRVATQVTTTLSNILPVIKRLRLPSGLNAQPFVSVVIPVYNNLNHTLACLDSIARQMPKVAIEVLIIDDESSDATEAELSVRDDIRYLRNPHNLGFVGSCNRGAEAARGEFLFFLNNDTVVLEGWLDALVETFAAIPDAGLVGSKLIYPDGRLQEAGGIIWFDASGWNWGRLADPAAPEYNFLRDVDYCSGAAVLVRRALFNDLGGFDQRYAPAYYEDTDLAFAVRARGFRVLYQPLSQIIHYEGITSGTDINSGVKAYQVRNRERFREKWADVLVHHGDTESQPLRFAADRRPCARMLIIDDCTPTPDQDSGSLDMLNYLRLLIEFGYRITFIPASNLLHFGRYTNALQSMGVECLYHPYLSSIDVLLKERGTEFDAVMLVRVTVASEWIDQVQANCPHARLLFNTVDLHFLREQRLAELQTGQSESVRSAALRKQELAVIKRVDTTIVISPVEQALLAREVPEARVRVIPILREIPGRMTGFAERRDIVFVGGFRHPPNIDAMLWFCAEIWPLIRQSLSEVNLTIVGSHMVPEVQALEGHGVHVLGFVEELTPIFNQARISIAPLRYGAGQKGKVVTSLSYGVPCVLTPIAAEGMGLANDEGALIAETPTDFAAAVAQLYQDAELWQRLSDGGLQRVERDFSLKANRERLANLLNELGLPNSY